MTATVGAEPRAATIAKHLSRLMNCSTITKKIYVTGGIGSSGSYEGFGPNYSLPNNAYCESCSQLRRHVLPVQDALIYHDAKYADLYEDTLYNALLGDIDLGGTI